MSSTAREEHRPFAAYGWRRGETCSACSIKGACNRSMRSTNGLEDRNRCSIGFRHLEDELWNAGLEERQFLTPGSQCVKKGCGVFRRKICLMTGNRRRALAESYFELGETGKAEALYRDWLHADPRWGWGWIGWSDGYGITRTKFQDWQRAEQIGRA